MALLDRLSIQGIRSFCPDKTEEVKFSSPLTLFLGHNGCGKTTIIECLKFALTSDLPQGTDKGQGFLNDPKLSNKTSTRGVVKLRFRDCKEDFVTVEKFIEVETADGKLKFKTENQTIRWEDDKGNFRDIGHGVNAYCAQKLNVSQPIINNVIFCHQENSAWPMEEGKKLKKKFDEIFGSTEYDECVNRLRALIKDKRANHIVLAEQLKQKRERKENTQRLKDSLVAKEELLETIKNQIEQKERELEPLQKRRDEINELLDTITALHLKLTGLEKTLEVVIEHQLARKKHLDKEYEGTDEELDHDIENFHDFEDNIEKQISLMEEKRKKIENTFIDISRQLQKLQGHLFQLKQEEGQHLKRVEEMTDLVEKAKVKLNVITETTEPIPDILHKLKAAVTGEETNFNQFKTNAENEEKQLQEIIDGVRDKYAGAKENVLSKTNLATDFTKKKEEAETKLKSLSHSNSQIELYEKGIRGIEEKLREKRADFNEDREQHELDDLELDNQIVQKDEQQNKLEREYRTLQQNYVTEQNIEREKILVTEKEREIETIKGKRQHQFEALFGNNLPHQNIAESVKVIQKREDEKVTGLSKTISEYERRATSLELTIKHNKENLRGLKEELRQSTGTIERFADVLQQCYIKKEKLQKDKGTYRSAKTLFEEFINQFEATKPCCPVCETDFSEKKGIVPSIIKKLKSKIEKLPNKLIQIESDLKKEADFYNEVQQLKSVNENLQILQDARIRILEEELQQTTEKLEETNLELGSLNNDVINPKNTVEICRQVHSDASLLDRLTLDIKKSATSLESMKDDLVHVSSNRTLDQTETELSKLKEDLKILRRQYKTKRDLYDETRESIQRLNGRLQNEKEKKLEIQKLVQEQPLLEKQIEEYISSITELDKEKASLSAGIFKLEKELRDADRRRDEVVQKNKRLLEEQRLELDARKRLIDDIQKLHSAVDRYDNGESKTKLETVLKSLDEVNGKLSYMENAKKVLNDNISEKKEELAGQGSKLRALRDNKELRESRGTSRELEGEIKTLKRQIGNHNSETILLEERKKVVEKIESKQDEKSIKTGEQNAAQQAIKEYRTDLTKKEHRQAVTKFKKKYYEMKVEEMAMQDLVTYSQVLEMSILKFHKERMVQINMTIRELWRSIYKGNDIDCIEIQMDDEISSDGRRTYNYKVVQVKKGVELEMRGRCSAGQRVLACLVIRMALAETFSANCGILALDEPTTNLDRDNIMSLSDALSEIITAREKQKSFQLLVITHDEEFLQTLTREHSVSHFFRVQRNVNGFSEITKEVL